MFSILYQSEASYEFTEADLAVLLMNSRANNHHDGLTGLLLHRDGDFMQVLEGLESAVRARFDLIAADPRHRNIAVISESHRPDRRYPAWTMGYRAVTGTFEDQLPGFSPIYLDSIR